jgi:thimet oligopeptidase
MHEFGHVLHGVLSQADYNPHAGTSVKGDFVEAPSQMFEEWARREQPLALFKKVCAECPQLTSERSRAWRRRAATARASATARQWLYALVRHGAVSPSRSPPLHVWKNLEGATPLGFVEGTSFPSSFSHIANNTRRLLRLHVVGSDRARHALGVQGEPASIPRSARAIATRSSRRADRRRR